jgi:hypothetical protein
MNNKIRLSIPKPCAENWDSFKPAEKGGYCSSCEKTVIDFSKMSNRAIVAYFQNHQSDKTCGRFKSHQLGEIGINSPKSRFTPLKYLTAGIFGMSLLVTASETGAKNHDSIIEINEIEKNDLTQQTRAVVSRVVEGIVTDENGEGLPGVYIVLKGTMLSVRTDLDGKFKFTQELNFGDVLIFSFIGYERIEHKISEKDGPTLYIQFDEAQIAWMGEVQVDGLYTEKQGLLKRMWQGMFGS